MNVVSGHRFAIGSFVADGKLTPAEARTAIESDSFWSLCVELRRIEAAGYDVQAVLRRVVGQRNLLDADDACAVILTRFARDGRHRTRSTRRPTQLIAGLVPPALGPMPEAVRKALSQRAALIEATAGGPAQAANSTGASPQAQTGSVTEARERHRTGGGQGHGLAL